MSSNNAGKFLKSSYSAMYYKGFYPSGKFSEDKFMFLLGKS